jgi:hypothetical protein
LLRHQVAHFDFAQIDNGFVWKSTVFRVMVGACLGTKCSGSKPSCYGKLSGFAVSVHHSLISCAARADLLDSAISVI